MLSNGHQAHISCRVGLKGYSRWNLSSLSWFLYFLAISIVVSPGAITTLVPDPMSPSFSSSGRGTMTDDRCGNTAHLSAPAQSSSNKWLLDPRAKKMWRPPLAVVHVFYSA